MAEEKKYKLNKEEVGNIKFRRTVMNYMADAINNETSAYMYTNIRPRLGLKDNVVVELSEDGEWLIEKEEPKTDSGIVLPNGMKVTPKKVE